MAVGENIQAVAQAGSSEIAHATLLQKVSLGALACSLAFEWGTGNEALMGVVGGNVLQATHNALTTAIATGGASFTEQAIFGLVATVAVANFPQTTAKIRERFFPDALEHKDDGQPREEPRNKVAAILGRFTTAFALGTAVPVIARSTLQERTMKENAKDVLTDAALIGLGVAAIAGAASGVQSAGEALGLQQQAHVLVDVIKSPFTYVSLFGAKMVSDLLNKRSRKSPKEEVHASSIGETNPAAQSEIYKSPDNKIRVVASNTLAERDREAVWEIIEQGFQDLNSRAGSKQDMTRLEFEEDVNSPEVYHYVAYGENNEPLGFLNMHWGLDSVQWAPDAMKDRMTELQRSVNPNASPLYVGTLVVPENLRAREVTPALIRASYSHWEQLNRTHGNLLCFFDCAQANYPKLPHLLQFLARPSTRDDFRGVPLQVSEIGKVQDGTEDILESDTSGKFTNNVQHYFSLTIAE